VATTFVKKAAVDKVIAKVHRTVTHTPVTKTLHPVSGDETLTAGSPVSILAVFVRRERRWYFDKVGLIEGGDAYLIVNPTVATVAKEDLITVNSQVYRVRDVITRYAGVDNAEAVYTYCNLFLNS
jgi:hypothetical protein